MTIHHLILSGGGVSGVASLGSIHELIRLQYININEIKTIHATSVGCIISLLLCFHKLNIDNESIKDYFIQRPFHELYKINIEKIINLYHSKGLFDEKSCKDLLKPFFNTIYLDLNITMKQLYELTSLELFFYSVGINNFEVRELSHHTTPDLTIINAIYMSSTIPIILKPLYYENEYFIDGGFLCNYPIKQCIDMNYKKDEIFGIYFSYESKDNLTINENTNLINILLIIFRSLIILLNNILNNHNNKEKINELEIGLKDWSLTDMKGLFCCEKSRKELYDYGVEKGTQYYNEVFKNCDK
jgi:predicted acylesterase/phospholipase RssA